MTDLLVAEGVLWLTTGPVLAKERIANGLVVDLVLAEAVTVDERWELRPTGVMPQDPLLADAIRLLQASPPPVAATAFTKELAHPRQSHQPPLPLVPPLVWPLVAGWHQLKVARRRVKHPKLAPVPVLQQRAAHRGPKQAEAVRRAVCDVLLGRRDLDDVGPRMYLLAGLIPAGALVGRDDRDAARHRAAEIAAGALDPGSADAVVRHAATRALPALAV